MIGHRVNVERLKSGGVTIYLDGMRVKALSSWSLVEEISISSKLTLSISASDIVWGTPEPSPPAAPPAFVDDGERHWFDRVAPRFTPSGKNACETCGEAWTCSTYIRRGEWPPEVDKDSGTPLS